MQSLLDVLGSGLQIVGNCSASVRLLLLKPRIPAFRSQVYGYWPIGALCRRPSFQRIVSWIIRTLPLRYRLAQELGPAPIFAASTTGVWLGAWDNGTVAIGVVGMPQGLRPILSKYAAIAAQIYFPYPAPYQGIWKDADRHPDGFSWSSDRSPPPEASLTSGSDRLLKHARNSGHSWRSANLTPRLLAAMLGASRRCCRPDTLAIADKVVRGRAKEEAVRQESVARVAELASESVGEA